MYKNFVLVSYSHLCILVMSRTSHFVPGSDDSDEENCAGEVLLEKTLTRIIFDLYAE